MNTKFTSSIIFQRLKATIRILLFSSIFLEAGAATLFVHPAGNDNNTGTSWGQSFQTVQRALEVSVSGDQIWVASGTYTPSISMRSIAFEIPSGVKVYGGFAGTEQNLAERDPDLIHTVNQTILSGDLASNDAGFSNQGENSYRIVVFQNVTTSTEIDGFTISGAYNNLGNQESGFGGGIYNNGAGSGNTSNPSIRNCKFEYNTAFIGGGLYNDGINNGNASPVIENCTFINNRSIDSGAAMANYGTSGNSSPIISRCYFIGNSAGYNSGAMNNHGFAGNSSPIITNSVFIGNSAENNGGVMVNTASSGGTSNPVITNCSFSGNRGYLGGVIRNLEANVQIQNSIIWGNSSNFNLAGGTVTVINSIVEGGLSGSGNLDSDPQFMVQPDFNLAPTTIGNLQLNQTSPAINAGTNSGAPANDILGNIRPFPGTITDMGAYESIPEITCFSDTDGDGFGNPAMSQQFVGACGSGFVSNNTDCNDNSAIERPGQVWYKDTDNDGYAQTGAPGITQCLRPAGYKVAAELTNTSGDCNDNNAGINPAATEICDGVDNNCNGQTDEGVLITYYRDMDGDSFGNPAVTQSACTQPVGYVTNNTDCNDNDALERPGQVWYKDSDNDGYAQTGAPGITQCLRPAGYKVAAELTSITGDCNDNNVTINPAATEICDGVDNNCNGQTDEGDLITYYRDMDGDSFGNPAVTQSACTQPVGYVANNTDCDDNDALERPGQVWYKDTDNDGYAQTGAGTITQCLRPAGYKVAAELTNTTGDCNDNNAGINPAATEICDGIDNNCNAAIDEGVLTTYYADNDGDGFGDPLNTTQACSIPIGFVINNTDCDDNDALERPGQVWYKDFDNDGYAQTGAATIAQCLRPAGYKVADELTNTTGDCNDNNIAINPAATEICDGIDNNCNGQTDEGVTTRYFYDFDQDGFGESISFQDRCAPAGFYTALLVGDCNNNDNTIYPGAPELCDGKDNDCDDQTDEEVTTRYYYDFDGDGYGLAATFIDHCAPVGFYSALVGGDCIDSDNTIYPGAPELCDGKDNDCNGQTDEGVTTRYYYDFDGDGFGESISFQDRCAPSGYFTALVFGDCNNNDNTIYPGAPELCDGKDNDCNGNTDEGNVCCPSGNVIFVDVNATGANNGSSWEDAYTQLQNGINNNCPGITQIWVASGTYYPTNDGNRSVHFTMRNNRAIYGGFDGTETMLSQRDIHANPTILSGDIGIPNDMSDNSFHVVRNYNINLNTSARLDGFTITGGNANGSSSNRYGGGLFNFRSAAIYASCTFVENSTIAFGGGVANQNSAPTFLNCHFINNNGTSAGGGMYNESSAPVITNCSFTGNFSQNGGGIYASNSSNPILTNCSFSGNRASGQGGAVLNFTGSTSSLTNCIIWNNQVGDSQTAIGASIGNASANATAIISYSIIENSGGSGAGWQNAMGTDDGNNLDSDPMFVMNGSPASAPNALGDLHLQSCSPAIDSGTADQTPATDIEGNPRPSLSGFDMGAYEFVGIITARISCYQDNDGDGYGDASNQQYTCESCTSGYVSNDSDCDDTNEDVNPTTIWYLDADNDGYYTGTGIIQCESPGAFYKYTGLIGGGDCDDSNPAVNPGAEEICNGMDDDCNSLVDDGLPFVTYFADADGDGYGDPNMYESTCDGAPDGYLTDNTDCDDTNADINPTTIWYLDADNDDYYTGSTITQCLSPGVGYTYTGLIGGGDCDDNNDAVNPAAEEVCNDIDDDCNGIMDDLGGSTQGNWVNEDIGNANGSSEYPPCEAEPQDTFNIQSYGFGQQNNDTRHMVYQTLCGDMSISARILDIKGGGWAGISMQESVAPGSKKAALKTQLTNFIFREIRLATGAPQNLQMLTRPQHKWLKLERIGNAFTGYTSINGISWSFAFTASIPMNQCIHIGLFVESNNDSNETNANIDQVVISGAQNSSRPIGIQFEEENITETNLELEAFPNPVNDYLYLRLNHSRSISAKIHVLSLLGELVLEAEVADIRNADSGINVSHLAAGIYLLRVTSSDNESVTKRMIKQ